MLAGGRSILCGWLGLHRCIKVVGGVMGNLCSPDEIFGMSMRRVQENPWGVCSTAKVGASLGMCLHNDMSLNAEAVINTGCVALIGIRSALCWRPSPRCRQFCWSERCIVLPVQIYRSQSTTSHAGRAEARSNDQSILEITQALYSPNPPSSPGFSLSRSAGAVESCRTAGSFPAASGEGDSSINGPTLAE
jgi:hypothetical protein